MKIFLCHNSPNRNFTFWYNIRKKGNLLAALAPPTVEMLNLWNNFRKVVAFIDENQEWLLKMRCFLPREKQDCKK